MIRRREGPPSGYSRCKVLEWNAAPIRWAGSVCRRDAPVEFQSRQLRQDVHRIPFGVAAITPSDRVLPEHPKPVIRLRMHLRIGRAYAPNLGRQDVEIEAYRDFYGIQDGIRTDDVHDLVARELPVHLHVHAHLRANHRQDRFVKFRVASVHEGFRREPRDLGLCEFLCTGQKCAIGDAPVRAGVPIAGTPACGQQHAQKCAAGS